MWTIAKIMVICDVYDGEFLAQKLTLDILLLCDCWGHYATSRMIAGSIPDEVVEFFFN
jgi:hypothetical protein